MEDGSLELKMQTQSIGKLRFNSSNGTDVCEYDVQSSNCGQLEKQISNLKCTIARRKMPKLESKSCVVQYSIEPKVSQIGSMLLETDKIIHEIVNRLKQVASCTTDKDKDIK